jgi:hypothetical protein
MRTSSRSSIFVCFLIMVLLAAASPALSADENGEWTLNQSDIPDHLQFSLQSSQGGYRHFSSSSDWNTSEFRGLDLSTSGKHDVRFTIARDAGSFECEGFVDNGAGAGLFTFRANAQYDQQMASLGFPGISNDRQFAFAVHDVSLAFARGLQASGVKGLDVDKLVAFRIHGVSPEFIKSLKAAGVDANDEDKLIAFRIHGVSPEFVKSLKAAGVDISDSNKLIAFRIHGVSPEFVNDLARLGYAHPDPDKLVALRIHGVTPEYIETLRSRGVQNLTLDQLIALRIHGIE